MLGRAQLLACALILVAIASQVEAGLKNLLSRDKSYEQFANDLYKLTSSSELRDNTAAAASGLSKTGGAYDDLLASFTSLKDTSEEEICDSSSLKSLHRLAESMETNGNLGPKKITEPVRRLNLIIIGQIMKAQDVCFNHLAKNWPSPWMAVRKWPEQFENLHEMDSLPDSLLLDKRPNLKAKEFDKVDHASFACSLIQHAPEADSILKPYLDLLMAAYIIDPESNKLAKFYEAPSEQIVFKPIHHPNKEVLDNARRLRACELLAPIWFERSQSSLKYPIFPGFYHPSGRVDQY